MEVVCRVAMLIEEEGRHNMLIRPGMAMIYCSKIFLSSVRKGFLRSDDSSFKLCFPTDLRNTYN